MPTGRGFRSKILHLIVVLTELRDKVTPACPLHTALQALPTTDARYTDVLAMLRRAHVRTSDALASTDAATRLAAYEALRPGNRTRRRRIARAAHGGARAAVRLAAPWHAGPRLHRAPIAGHGRRVGRCCPPNASCAAPPRRHRTCADRPEGPDDSDDSDDALPENYDELGMGHDADAHDLEPTAPSDPPGA